MAPAPEEFSNPGSVTYDSDTMSVGDGTWDFTKNTFLLPNLAAPNFETMRYNGMGNRFSTLTQYHTIIIAHGVLGALVFLLLIPSALMLMRFYDRRPGAAVRYHVQLHIFSAILLTIVFILGNIAVGPKRSLTNPHHVIGLVLYVLFCVQFLAGIVIRGIKKLRSLRVTLHQWIGRSIALLGIAQVPLGLTLYGSPKYTFILFAVWMAFLFVLYFILNFTSASRREYIMSGGAPSEAGRTRVTGITDTEYFASEAPQTEAPHGNSKLKWLGPLAAGGATFAFLNRKKNKDRGRSHSRSRSRSRSRSLSPSYRSHGPQTTASRHGPASYFSDEKYSELPPPRKQGGGGGFMKVFGGAAAALGAGKLVSGLMSRKDKQNRSDEYSAVSTETPRRQRPGRFQSELSSVYTEDTRPAPTETSLMSPTPNPPPPPMMAGALSAADSRLGTRRNGSPPRASGGAGRRPGRRSSFEDSEYSSYVSPSRRAPPPQPSRGGTAAKGLMTGLGLGWFTKKLADKRAKKEEDKRFQDEDDMRSGLTEPRYTGDGYGSPSRKSSRRPLPRRQTGMPSQVTATEMTESSFDDDSRPPGASRATHPVPVASGTGKMSRARSNSRHDTEPLGMPPGPAMPLSPGPLSPEAESSILSDPRSKRRDSSRRPSLAEKASKATQGRTASLAAEQDRERQRYGSPHSQSVSLKLKVHDDKDRNVTLRRLTEEEARTARGNRSRSRADSESDMSGLDSPGFNRTRYRRDSSQRRAESTAERRTEAAEQEISDLGPLSPPNPAFAKGRRNAGKDSAYYSGGAAGQPGPAGTSVGAGQTVSNLGSPESHGTWSEMSGSQTNPDRAPTVASAAAGSAADTRRQRRRMERRRGSSSRPTGADMFE